MNQTHGNLTLLGSSSGSCPELEGFSTFYLTILLAIIAVGLTLSLFVIVVIGWYPDLYTSKHISQAFCLGSNLLTLSSVGFITLSTFIPTVRSCSLVQVLTFLTLGLFVISEATVHVDFYTAIVFPFWHEHIADKETSIRWCSGSVITLVSVAIVLYFMGILRCDTDCPQPAILNQVLTSGNNIRLNESPSFPGSKWRPYHRSVVVLLFGVSDGPDLFTSCLLHCHRQTSKQQGNTI